MKNMQMQTIYNNNNKKYKQIRIKIRRILMIMQINYKMKSSRKSQKMLMMNKKISNKIIYKIIMNNNKMMKVMQITLNKKIYMMKKL